MTGFGRAVRLAVGVLVLAWAGAAGAQDNLDRGKSGAQLYGSDCAICHKSAQKLDIGSAGGIFGLESFLREHYTASRESAALIAAYLRGVQEAAAATRSSTRKRGAKSERHGKPAEKKSKATASAKPKTPE